MKKFFIVVLGAVLLTGCLGFEGCKNPQATTYQTVATTKVSVETVMHLWGAYVASGNATVAQEIQVRDAYQKYQAAMLVVCDAGAIYSASSLTNAVGATGLSAALQQAILNATNSIADLENLVTSFGVKLS
jgi:hypothetical protein